MQPQAQRAQQAPAGSRDGLHAGGSEHAVGGSPRRRAQLGCAAAQGGVGGGGVRASLRRAACAGQREPASFVLPPPALPATLRPASHPPVSSTACAACRKLRCQPCICRRQACAWTSGTPSSSACGHGRQQTDVCAAQQGQGGGHARAHAWPPSAAATHPAALCGLHESPRPTGPASRLTCVDVVDAWQALDTIVAPLLLLLALRLLLALLLHLL